MAELKGGTLSKEKALSMVDAFAETASLELLPLVQALLNHEDREVRGQALSLLEGLSDASLIPIIQDGMRDADPAVRLQSMELTAHVRSPALSSVLTSAYGDTDSNVRLVAFQTAIEQPLPERQKLIVAAVNQPNQDVAQSAVDLLEAEPSKFSIHTIMDGLDHGAPFIRERSHDILALTFGRPFKSAAEAKTWWSAHEKFFDQDMVQIQEFPRAP